MLFSRVCDSITYGRNRKRIAVRNGYSKRKRLSLNENIDILEYPACNTNMGARAAFADKFSVSKTRIEDSILS